ncbi:MAG TPA: AbrB family transcriptional regulator [Meiothermus sp.]|jgi:membrane AbrB-like protein|nr:AbrB family transcriptional regulator [Meiothermus sp.]
MSAFFAASLGGITLGLVFWRLSLPGGPVVGAMIGAALYQFLAPSRAITPNGMDLVVQLAAGILIGLSFNRELLQIARQTLPWAVGAALAFIGLGVGLAWIVARFSGISLTTALFGLAPGGITGMGVLAQAEGGKPALVGVFHTVRIILTFLLVPLVGRLLHR